MKIDVENILLLLIIFFGLYLVMNRCGCNIDSGFSVGGSRDSIKTIKNFFHDNTIGDIYDKLETEFNYLHNQGQIDMIEDLVELPDIYHEALDRQESVHHTYYREMIDRLNPQEKKRLYELIVTLNDDEDRVFNPFEGQAE